MICQTCTTPTKYILGLWDGANGTHGAIFDCHNLDCDTKQSREKAIAISGEEKDRIILENVLNGIDAEKIKAKRRELGITIRRMAEKLGISCSDYSNYEMCRRVLTVEIRDRINELFEKERQGK